MSGSKSKLLILGLFVSLFLFGSEIYTISFDWESVRHYNKYQQDFFYLCHLLEDSHPAFPEELKQQIHKTAGSLELVVDRHKFALILQRFVSALNDGHTKIYFEQDFVEQYLPLAFSWSEENLVISNVNRGENIGLIGSRVISLGEYTAAEIESSLGQYVSAENKYWRRVQLSKLLNNVGFLLMTGVIQSEDSVEIVIEKDGKKKKQNFQAVSEVSWLRPAAHPVTGVHHRYFSYKILPEMDVCYFQFNQFHDSQTARVYHKAGLVSDQEYGIFQEEVESRGGDFRIFLEWMFLEISQQGINNLVIDLRNNGGGNSILANQFFYHIKLSKPLKTYTTSIKLSELMKHYYPETVEYYQHRLSEDFGIVSHLPYLYDLELETKDDYFEMIRNNEGDFYLPQPVYRFEGDLYFLTGNRTFSSAGDMVTIAYDNDIGTIIGEPMGQKPTSYGDVLYFTLPNSGIEGGVSHKIFNRPRRSRSEEKTIVPDHTVHVDLYDKYIRGIDPVWDKTLEVIGNKKKEDH